MCQQQGAQGAPINAQRLEQGLGHDVLLDLELVRVEQDRHGGEHCNPSPDAEPDEQGVDRDTHAQSEDVLNPDDNREVAHREDRAEQESDVSDGLRDLFRVEVVQIAEVPVRVDVQQGGPVGDLGHDPQRERDAQNRQEDPVPARSNAETSSLLRTETALAPLESWAGGLRHGGSVRAPRVSAASSLALVVLYAPRDSNPEPAD